MKLRVLALATLVFAALAPVSSQAFVAVSVGFAPPVLPIYAPPPVPVAGYIWTPGYWAYDPLVGYYWVPGAWVPPPAVGLLWTPPWWGFDNGLYAFHEGYWGPTVGYYGGINYGYGYFGRGYGGGYWDGNVFRYNTAVVRVNDTVIHNTFVDRSVLSRQTTASHVSFNGPGGVQAQPTAQEKAAEASANKMPPTSQQLSRREAAAKDPKLQASANNGHPQPDAIKTFNETHEQAQAGAAAGKAAERRETAATSTTKAATEYATLGQAERERARVETAEARERADAAERREADLRSTRARESASARQREMRQHQMTERSRRPEMVPGRRAAAMRRFEPAGQQQGRQQQARKKPAKGQPPGEYGR